VEQNMIKIISTFSQSEKVEMTIDITFLAAAGHVGKRQSTSRAKIVYFTDSEKG
jgi:hypothetical protein